MDVCPNIVIPYDEKLSARMDLLNGTSLQFFHEHIHHDHDSYNLPLFVMPQRYSALIYRDSVFVIRHSNSLVCAHDKSLLPFSIESLLFSHPGNIPV